MERDRVFARKQHRIKPFAFNRKVAKVFDDMLVRSVPLYKESIYRQTRLACRFYQAGTRMYDLGCSHGNLGQLICEQFQHQAFTMVGVDSSWPMLEKYRQRLPQFRPGGAIHLVCGSMEDIKIENASVVVVNLTLQFLDAARRDGLICRIFSGLLPGGIVLLMEKTVHPDAFGNALEQDVYRQFKRENGYSDLEISQKRDALEKVLVPDTLEAHFRRLEQAGFSFVDVLLKWFNFSSIIAVKSPCDKAFAAKK